MFSVNTGILLRLSKALISGDENLIENMVQVSVERAGKQLIENFLDSTIFSPTIGRGTAARIEAAVVTGGLSEIDRLRQQWLNSTKPLSTHNRVLSKAQGIFQKHLSDKGISKGRSPVWARTDWAKSREQWLSEGWKHDWRSQPRNAIGRWIPGRLPYPVAGASLRGGKTIGKARRMMRQRRRRYRAIGRSIGSGSIMSSWGKFDAD